MENFTVKLGSLWLAVVAAMGMQTLSTPVPTANPLAPIPSQIAEVATLSPTPTLETNTNIPVLVLHDLTNQANQRRSHFALENMPVPTTQIANKTWHWKSETKISLQDAIKKSQASAKNIKQICTTKGGFACSNDPLALLTNNFGISGYYQGKFLVIWYSQIKDANQFDQAKTYLAEYSSLDAKQTLASSIFSLDRVWTPSGQYSSLNLLNIAEVIYRTDGGQGCVSSTCGYTSLLIKHDDIVGQDNKVVIAMGRYGGGTSCVVLSPEAVLLCSSSDWNTHAEKLEATSLK